LRVQLLPCAAQQAAVCRVLDQRVLEAIDRIGRRAALEDQLGRDEAGERGFQLALGKAAHSTQQWVRELASDRRTGLRHQPHRRQPVEPRHQRVLQRRRDR